MDEPGKPWHTRLSALIFYLGEGAVMPTVFKYVGCMTEEVIFQ